MLDFLNNWLLTILIFLPTLGAIAQAIAPSVNSALTPITDSLRPIRSDSQLVARAPITAPARIAAVTISCMR